jgi:hypothetical protein
MRSRITVSRLLGSATLEELGPPASPKQQARYNKLSIYDFRLTFSLLSAVEETSKDEMLSLPRSLFRFCDVGLRGLGSIGRGFGSGST